MKNKLSKMTEPKDEKAELALTEFSLTVECFCNPARKYICAAHRAAHRLKSALAAKEEKILALKAIPKKLIEEYSMRLTQIFPSLAIMSFKGPAPTCRFIAGKVMALEANLQQKEKEIAALREKMNVVALAKVILEAHNKSGRAETGPHHKIETFTPLAIAKAVLEYFSEKK